MKWLYLPTKPSHVGVDADGLAYPLHWPTAHSYQTRVLGLLLGDVLSCRCSGQWRLSGDVKPPLCVDIDGKLSASIPALLNLRWGKSFLSGDALLVVGSS
jgi:hypothetical protein